MIKLDNCKIQFIKKKLRCNLLHPDIVFMGCLYLEIDFD